MNYHDWLWRHVEDGRLTPERASEMLCDHADMLRDIAKDDAVMAEKEKACIDNAKVKESNT